jgi:anti-anti-sigma factor
MSTSDDYAVRTFDDVTVVRLKNQNLTSILDINQLNSELEALIDQGAHKLVLDLKNVRYVGSAALGMLLSLYQRAKAAGGRLILSHPEHIEELLRVSRTSRIFETAPDPKAAVAMFNA